VRLQAIRDRWFSEPLKAHFPPLIDDPFSHALPANCHELISGTRLSSAFSSLHESPAVTGKNCTDALAHDRDMNYRRFRVEYPAALMLELSHQFDCAPGGQVDLETLKKGYVLLDDLRCSSLELVDEFRIDPPAEAMANDRMKRLMRESYLADAAALGQAQGMVHELAGELGISLPLSRGTQRRR
jgi:hypothetical protein